MSLTNNNPVCVIQVNDSLHIYVVAGTSTEFVLGLNEYDYMHVEVRFNGVEGHCSLGPPLLIWFLAMILEIAVI